MSLTRSPFDITNFRHLIQTIADPVVANPVVIPAPTDHLSAIVNISFLLTTDANAANRNVRIIHTRGAQVSMIGSSCSQVIASKACKFTVSPEQNRTTSNPSLHIVFPVTGAPFIIEGDTISITLEVYQVGDQLSDCFVIWKTWVNPD